MHTKVKYMCNGQNNANNLDFGIVYKYICWKMYLISQHGSRNVNLYDVIHGLHIVEGYINGFTLVRTFDPF